jgi:hypothetical protein
VAFFELVLQFFFFWVRLQPEVAIPAGAVSQCDGGHLGGPDARSFFFYLSVSTFLALVLKVCRNRF